MEQATTGKAPPPIAINSGGGIQILNMNAVRGPAGIGASVVPSPGSAQTATVVGSPGPPGKAVGGGGGAPRMISFSPQMLANARPGHGQPVEESDSESVNQCDDDVNHELLKTTNTEPEPRRSPSSASNTGVYSSDLQQQHACDDNVTVVDDKCEEGELQKDDSFVVVDNRPIIVNAKVASASDNHFEGSEKSTIADNDLNRSNPPSGVEKSVTELGSPNQRVVINERSVPCTSQYSHSLSSCTPPLPPHSSISSPVDGDDSRSPPRQSELENEPMTCDENKNHESGSTVGFNSYLPPPPTSIVEVENLELREEKEVDGNSSSINSYEDVNSNSDSIKDLVSEDGAYSPKESKNYVVKLESEDRNEKCIYDKVKNDVPVPRTSVFTTQPDQESDFGASKNNNSVDNSTSQICVQTTCEKSIVLGIDEKCDKVGAQEKAIETGAEIALDTGKKSPPVPPNTTTENSPGAGDIPPLVHEERKTDMGNKESSESQVEVEENSVAPADETTVDDVNLDMFSDSGAPDSGDSLMTLHNPNGAIVQLERVNFSEDTRLHASSSSMLSREDRSEEEREVESRPKLMDMNLVDLIYMDCDEGMEAVGGDPFPAQPVVNNGGSVLTWNHSAKSTAPIVTAHSVAPVEHPYSPPKIINAIPAPPASRASTILTGGPTNTYAHSSHSPSFYNKNKTVLENQQEEQDRSPPSCAFQFYEQHLQPQQGTLQVAARITMRNAAHNSTRLSYPSSSSGTRQPQPSANPYSNLNNLPIRDGATNLPTLPNNNSPIPYPYPSSRANINNTNVSSEYKTNMQSQSQQQSCFTNDPQLYSQFLQYTKNFPLGHPEDKQEQAAISPSSSSSAAGARGQYVQSPMHQPPQQPNHVHTNKSQTIKSATGFPQQSHQHQVQPNVLRQPTGVLQQQRHYSPVVSQHHHYPLQQHPQSTPQLQSQYRSNNINANGCDNLGKVSYHNMRPAVNSVVNFHDSSNYNIGHGQSQPPTSVPPSSSIRPAVAAGGTTRPYFSHSSQSISSSSTTQSQLQIRQHHQQNPSTMQKELTSCSYANVSGVAPRMPVNQPGMYNQARMSYTNLSGTLDSAAAAATGPQHNSYTHGNYRPYNSMSSTGPNNTRMPYPQQHPVYSSQIRPTPNLPSTHQIPVPSNKSVGSPSSSTSITPPSGWNPPLLQGARAQLLQVLRPGAFSNQNLGRRGGEITNQPPRPQQTPHHPNASKLPYPVGPPQPHSMQHQQNHYQAQLPVHGQQDSVPVSPRLTQQRSASVIAPRYPGGNSSTTSHLSMPGGSSDILHKQSPTSTSTLPSPQMLRNSQYVAHQSFMPTTTTSQSQGPSIPYNQSSVIRPTHYTGSGGSSTVLTATTSSNISSSNNTRPAYGNSSTNNNYGSNQASVIRAPPSSSASNLSNACTINRNSSNSCIVIERGGTHSNAGHHNSSASSSAGGYNSGELTLQSFLSNPSAPFMCPSPSSAPTNSSPTSPLAGERSSSVGSGYHYNSSSENWGGASYYARGDNQDETYPSLSSCQYSDGAMRRYNAPITLQSLQALSGLPPGANHLLVKTENGQFQLVSVRMQSPTAAAAAPGTPVVPSTVAAPPTSMSIAQQLPSNSPLAPPLPQPPHSAPPPGVTPPSLVPPPPISSSMITTTTIPPHPSAQQGRIITSSSSNHFVTSWSSSNNNSLVNNNSTTSSPLPVISSSAAHPPPPHPPHLGPPPIPPSAPHHPPSLPVPPPSVPSSVIMPPSLSSASNSQLLSTANSNIISSSSSSSSTSSTAAQAAISAVIENYNQQRAASSAQQQHGSVMGPPGGLRQQLPPPPTNSIPTVPVAPAAGPMSNSLPPGASVIRTGGSLGASSLPPPPPPVVVSTSSSAAVAAVVANSVISSSTNPSNSNLPSAAAPTNPATYRPQLQPNTASSPVPNNSATNNASGSMGMGMMTASSNSIMSVQHSNHHHHHQHQTPPPYNSQLHPHLQPPHQAPPSAYHTSYTSNSIASSTSTTANTVSQMSNETAKTKCKNFLSFLLELSAKQNQTVARNVKNLIQGLIDGKVNEENFADRLQKEVNSQPQPCLVGFLKKSLPHLRHSLAVNELKIEGIKAPPLATFVPPAPVSALVPQTPPTPPEPTRKKPTKQTPTVRPTTPTVPASPVRIITPPVNSASPSSTPPTPAVSASSSGTPAPPSATPSPSSTKSSKPSKGSSSKSKSNSSSNSSAAGGASASSGPGGTPSSKSSIPSTSKSSKEKDKKDKPFSSSGYSADDDINDVAAMGGVNLAEESQRILGSTEYVGTQIRSCRDETLIQASPISAKFKVIAARYGLEESPSAEVSALLSHAVEERLKTMIEKLSVIAEHRMDVIKLDERYEITQDVKGQLRFLEELDKLEKKRHDEQEREMLIRAAKSRSKSEDPEQAKLKAKAKEMQRVALEEMRQRDANLTALQAIGPRKKPKLDIAGGSHGSAVPSPMGTTGASSSLGRPQMPLRPRLKRVNLRDLLFLLEHDKETMRSPFLYKNLLLK